MALFETKSKNIKLLFKDSGDSLEKATEAAQEVVKEGASMIIGPIFSYQASEIRENISIDIPIFSFTNDETIKTEGLWTLGFSPHQQIDAIFYEMSHHAVTDISIIVPTNILICVTPDAKILGSNFLKNFLIFLSILKFKEIFGK